MFDKLLNDAIVKKLNKIIRHFKQLFDLECNYDGQLLVLKCPDIQKREELHDIFKAYPYNMRIQSVDGECIILDPQAVNHLIDVIDNRLTGRENFLKNVEEYIAPGEDGSSNLILTKQIPKNDEIFYELQFNEQADEEYRKKFLEILNEFGLSKTLKDDVIIITKFDIGRVDAVCHKRMLDKQAYQRLRAIDSAIKDIADQDPILSQLSKSFVMLLSSSTISQEGPKVVIDNFFGHEELFRIFKQIQEQKNAVAHFNLS